MIPFFTIILYFTLSFDNFSAPFTERRDESVDTFEI